MVDTTRREFVGGAAALAGLGLWHPAEATTTSYDVVVYGATPSGIMAAVAAAREGASTALVFDSTPLGGMMSQGLSHADIGTGGRVAVGGLARSFFDRCGAQYGTSAPAYEVEPHVATHVFVEILSGAAVKVIREGSLTAVEKTGTRIHAMVLARGMKVAARVFIDASYTGDLMAAAKVNFTVGRESAGEYGESVAGFDRYPAITPESPYDKSGRLLPLIRPFPGLRAGDRDHRIQSYTYRLCLSDDPANRLPWRKPAGYRPELYAFERERIHPESRFIATPLPNRKFDLNGEVFGWSWAYPDASYAQRSQIEKLHRFYQEGFLYFLANDPSVLRSYRDQVNNYGLAKDEFETTNNWPGQIYVREARRMIGVDVMTQVDLQTSVDKTTSIGVGSYSIDLHPVAVYAHDRNHVNLDGRSPREQTAVSLYQIPYGVLLPREEEAMNLIVSVCISASHVAFGSLRVEVALMTMGEAAGCAAATAAGAGKPVAHVSVPHLQARLTSHGGIISAPG